ncbi:MAG: DnaD domain protein [Clostridia bacterium]|nr:DnaD domain protein [Clostridia bacterium]
MTFEQNLSMLFSDLNIPEVFISEYMCNANGDYVKIYLYCLFLCKYGSEVSPLDLSKRLCLPLKTVEQGLKYWEENHVLVKQQSTYTLADLKKVEVEKLYKPKLTSSVEDAIEANTKNVMRNQIINTINNTFFQGVMSPAWYTDIDNLFTKYQFDEHVMYSLFKYCFDRQALHKKYLYAVAEGWASNNIKTADDLDKYYTEYEKVSQIKKTIGKKLGLSRKLSQYEDSYVDKWVIEYGYPMEAIELALKKTTSKTNPSFDYIDKIITNWHERNLSTVDDISAFLKEQKQKQKEIKVMETGKPSIPKYSDTQTNQYNDLTKFYANV